MSLYAWREVLSWVRDVIGIDPDEDVTYLDDAGHAQLNCELVASREWASVDAVTRRVSSNNAPAVAGTARPAVLRGRVRLMAAVA